MSHWNLPVQHIMTSIIFNIAHSCMMYDECRDYYGSVGSYCDEYYLFDSDTKKRYFYYNVYYVSASGTAYFICYLYYRPC